MPFTRRDALKVPPVRQLEAQGPLGPSMSFGVGPGACPSLDRLEGPAVQALHVVLWSLGGPGPPANPAIQGGAPPGRCQPGAASACQGPETKPRQGPMEAARGVGGPSAIAVAHTSHQIATPAAKVQVGPISSPRGRRQERRWSGSAAHAALAKSGGPPAAGARRPGGFRGGLACLRLPIGPRAWRWR